MVARAIVCATLGPPMLQAKLLDAVQDVEKVRLHGTVNTFTTFPTSWLSPPFSPPYPRVVSPTHSILDSHPSPFRGS